MINLCLSKSQLSVPLSKHFSFSYNYMKGRVNWKITRTRRRRRLVFFQAKIHSANFLVLHYDYHNNNSFPFEGKWLMKSLHIDIIVGPINYYNYYGGDVGGRMNLSVIWTISGREGEDVISVDCWKILLKSFSQNLQIHRIFMGGRRNIINQDSRPSLSSMTVICR